MRQLLILIALLLAGCNDSEREIRINKLSERLEKQRASMPARPSPPKMPASPSPEFLLIAQQDTPSGSRFFVYRDTVRRKLIYVGSIHTSITVVEDTVPGDNRLEEEQ